MKIINFPKYAPSNLSCKKCGRSPLWIEAFTYKEGKKTLAEPVLVCDSHHGCGTVFALTEYNITEEQLCK